MNAMKNWLSGWLTGESRKVTRKPNPPLVAYFWDGGHPVAHAVRDISSTGFYLITDQRWLVGTLIMMTLQKTKNGSVIAECTVVVLSKVIRHGEDGVGFEFVPTETATAGQHQAPGCTSADKKTLDHFLRLVSTDDV